MADHGLIKWSGEGGRLPGSKATEETELELHEQNNFHWGEWWLQLGGFDNASQTDANGLSGLHHACDHSLYSKGSRMIPQ